MILTSTANVMDEGMVHRALIRQHGQSHLRESDRPTGRQYYKPTAHTHVEQWDPWYFDAPASPENHEEPGHAYTGDGGDYNQGDGYPEENEDDYDYLDDEIEGLALVAMVGLEEMERTEDEDVALVAQSDLLAYMAWSKGGKGKGKDKGKSKGKGKFRIPRGPVSLEDRRRKLAELKTKSRCLRCGQTGHWAGDKECPRSQGKGSSGSSGPPKGKQAPPQGQRPTANVAISGNAAKQESEDDSEAEHHLGVSDDEGEAVASTAFVAAAAASAGAELTDESEPTTSFSVVDMEVSQQELADYAPPGYDRKFDFGQHAGLTYREVVTLHPDYYSWGAAQRTPSYGLRHFMTYVEQHYVIDGRTLRPKTEGVPAPAAATSAPSAPSVHTPKAKGKPATKVPPNPPMPEACSAGCTRFTRHGTNAHWIRLTCLDCGHVQRRPQAPAPTGDPSTCEHVHTDNRGSTKHIVKIFCKDCNNVVDEMPRHIFEQRSAVAHRVQHASSSTLRDIQRSSNDDPLDRDVLAQVLRIFERNSMLAVSENPITPSQLNSILMDAIDSVRTFNPTACVASIVSLSPTTSSPPSPCTDSSESTSDSEEPAPPPPDHLARPVVGPDAPVDLPTVCPFTDPGIWGVFDEGCNSSCHGSKWACNLEAKLKKLGYEPRWVHKVPKHYSGVGKGTTSVGLKRFPFSMKLSSGKLIAGIMDSHEMPDSNTPLLISQKSQTTLGLIKDMKNLSISLSGKPGTLPLARARGSGLLMVELGHLLGDSLPRSVRAMQYTGNNTDTCISEKHLDRARRSLRRIPSSPSEATCLMQQEQYECRFTLTSVGYLKMPSHHAISHTVTETYKGDHTLFDPFNVFGNQEPWHFQVLEQTLRKQHEFKYLFEKTPDGIQPKICYIDCRGFYDPEASSLRNHLGSHPDILDSLLRCQDGKSFKAFCSKVHACMKNIEGPIHFVLLCRSGKHRSYGLLRLLAILLEHAEVHGVQIPSKDGSNPELSRGCCRNCSTCNWVDKKASDKALQIFQEATAIFDSVRQAQEALGGTPVDGQGHLRRPPMMPAMMPEDKSSEARRYTVQPSVPPDRSASAAGSSSSKRSSSSASAYPRESQQAKPVSKANISEIQPKLRPIAKSSIKAKQEHVDSYNASPEADYAEPAAAAPAAKAPRLQGRASVKSSSMSRELKYAAFARFSAIRNDLEFGIDDIKEIFNEWVEKEAESSSPPGSQESDKSPATSGRKADRGDGGPERIAKFARTAAREESAFAARHDAPRTPTGRPPRAETPDPSFCWRTDCNPAEFNAITHERLFTDKRSNFIAWVGETGNEPKEGKIRVNGKFYPNNTKVGVPRDMQDWLKTTLGQCEDGQPWELIEDHVGANDNQKLSENRWAKIVVYLQPKPGTANMHIGLYTDLADTALYWDYSEESEDEGAIATAMLHVDLTEEHTRVLSAREKFKYNEFCASEREREDILWACLANSPTQSSSAVSDASSFAILDFRESVLEPLEVIKAKVASDNPSLYVVILDSPSYLESYSEVIHLLDDLSSTGIASLIIGDSFLAQPPWTSTFEFNPCMG